MNSVGFSRKLKKFTTSRQKYKQDVIQKISYDLGGINKVYSYITESAINNQNVCVYDGRISIFSLSSKTDYDFPAITKAKSLQDYEKAKDKVPYVQEEVLDRLDEFIQDYIFLLKNEVRFLRSEFQNCQKKVYFFPIRLEHLKVYDDEETWEVGRHACFLFVQPQQRKAYFVDSNAYQWRSEEASEEIGYTGYNRAQISKFVTDKLEYLLEHKFFGYKIPVKTLDVIGPQRTADDHNCRYWSILLIDLLSRFYGTPGFTPEKIINQMNKKYNTKRKLQTLVKRYISYIHSLITNPKFKKKFPSFS
jgi:hypothetical protein